MFPAPHPVDGVAAGSAVAATALLGSIVVANRGDEPLAFVAPSAVAFLGPIVTGSAIAIVGVVRRSAPLLLIAGTMLGVMSVAAFSGVTLILLVPSVLLFYAAAKRDGQPRREPTSVRWLIVFVAAIATAPVVVLLMTRVGVVGFVAALLLAVVVANVRKRTAGSRTIRPSARGIALVLVVAALLLAGTIVLYGRTERICWERLETPAGPVESTGPGSPTGEMVLTGPSEGGCGSVPTADGLALGVLLLGLAMAIAVAQRRQ
jgi:hypothetical protein